MYVRAAIVSMPEHYIAPFDPEGQKTAEGVVIWHQDIIKT